MMCVLLWAWAKLGGMAHRGVTQCCIKTNVSQTEAIVHYENPLGKDIVQLEECIICCRAEAGVNK